MTITQRTKISNVEMISTKEIVAQPCLVLMRKIKYGSFLNLGAGDSKKRAKNF